MRFFGGMSTKASLIEVSCGPYVVVWRFGDEKAYVEWREGDGEEGLTKGVTKECK